MSPFWRRLLWLVGGCVVPALLVLGWQYFYELKKDEVTIIASPMQALGKLYSDWDEFAVNLRLSLWRLIAGVVIGSVLGTASGIVLARNFKLRAVLLPSFQFVASVPLIVYLPFLLMLCGIGEVFKITVVAVSTMLLVNGHAFHAIRQLNPDYFELSQIYEKSRRQVLMQVLIPAALPAILSAIRFSLMFGWLAVALSEHAAAELPGGLGYQILRAKSLAHYAEMYAGAILLAVVAFGLDLIIMFLQKRLSSWTDTAETAEDKRTSPTQ